METCSKTKVRMQKGNLIRAKLKNEQIECSFKPNLITQKYNKRFDKDNNADIGVTERT